MNEPLRIQANAPQIDAILDGYAEPAIIIGTDYRILASNRAYRERYGARDEIAGRHCFEVSHHNSVPCDQAGETCPLRAASASGQLQRDLHVHFTPRGKEHVQVEMHPIRNEKGEICAFLELLRDDHTASAEPTGQGLVGRSARFNRALDLARRVAPTDTAVLLLGESGTGKELLAQAIHAQSPRSGGPFVAVECTGLADSLIESELFGHEKGAFTGADRAAPGLVESAAGGTLFLDEIGDMPLKLQVKLLRLLESGSYRRVGGTRPRKADFRLVCATHRDLSAMVEEGSFRRDLYYRINAFPIVLPSLRERIEDLPLLCESLLQRLAPGRRIHLAPETLARLREYAFPGNIRELRNILERALLLADDAVILPGHLVLDPNAGVAIAEEDVEFHRLLPLEELERRYLRWAVRTFPGDRAELAALLGISTRTLFRKLARSSLP